MELGAQSAVEQRDGHACEAVAMATGRRPGQDNGDMFYILIDQTSTADSKAGDKRKCG